ncbi:hypothetical protein CDAR_500621 [Caerostris darwini]|uniref:Uncharacterized protein n=1 Tax=Caerostris darwini TaxID=1538125 RepID=A0AAV4PD44_9ARAC|nr:hypothetical protein CDAR_500621 [Caerostris darwini]
MFLLDRREPSRRRRPSAQEVSAPQSQEPDRPEPPVRGGGGGLLPAAFPPAPFLPLPEDPGLPVRQEDPHRHLHPAQVQAEARPTQALRLV